MEDRLHNGLPYRVTCHPTQILGEFSLEEDAIKFGYLLSHEDDEECGEPLSINVYFNDKLIIEWDRNDVWKGQSAFEKDSFRPEYKVMRNANHIATIISPLEVLFFFRDTVEIYNQRGVKVNIRKASEELNEEHGIDLEFQEDDDEWMEVVCYDDRDLDSANRFYNSWRVEHADL